MSSLRQTVLVRHRRNLILLARFAAVGLSGVVVNMIVLIVANKLGPPNAQAIVGLPFSDFNVRWYHLYSTIAFLVANLWNFQLNRSWAFQSSGHAGWWKEYWPFLADGLPEHPDSVLSLPSSILDDSTGFRTRLYWAQLIVIAVVTPMSFVLNKLWTFNAVRDVHRREREARASELVDR